MLLVFSAGLGAQETKKVRVNGVELTYIEQGSGEPVILLHGGQADYRSWLAHLRLFAGSFRVIAYSRRYNFPNDNPIRGKNHSAYTEASDLAAFTRKLKLKKVHLVGTSIGAFTALIYAVKHPENVASLALAEPNIHAWVKDEPVYTDFMQRSWLPAREAFRNGDEPAAMGFLVDAFLGAGAFDKYPPQARTTAMQNARFFRAATLSDNDAPDISKRRVAELKMPILLIRGEKTFAMSKLIFAELERVLPKAERVVIPNAGHASPRENPEAFDSAVLHFLRGTTRN